MAFMTICASAVWIQYGSRYQLNEEVWEHGDEIDSGPITKTTVPRSSQRKQLKAMTSRSQGARRCPTMMCEVMPTINEDTPMSQRGSQSSGSDSDSHFEQLMVNMLDERDRLLDTLRETQESLSLAQQRLQDVIYDRDSLQRQLNSALPQDIESLTGGLTGSKGADPPNKRTNFGKHGAGDCQARDSEQPQENSFQAHWPLRHEGMARPYAKIVWM
ncbi:Liprin-alpha-2 [Fukomys damarensis]|uniref:Liprin-alpha-2 n=1 Tax=Fukomys damarensis TaxID=885580 RepID=A0A091CYR4_FUKDA|nr:Liprin-alpha-2 [Fukomys damarensis]